MARTVLHSRLEDGVEATRGVQKKIDEVTSALGRIQTVIETLSPTGKPIPEAFHCLRVLNQVEDLVTDHDFEYKKNNASLARRWKEKPTQDCVGGLGTDLAYRFQQVFRPFDSNSFEARAERYGEVDQLRHAIIRHFEASRPPSSMAGGAA